MSVLRRVGFFSLDKLQGSPVARHMKLLERAHQNLDLASEYREEALRALLEHATRYVPYYQQFRGLTRLSDFPTLSKSTVQSCYKDFLSTEFRADRLYAKSTSGSYGTPLIYRFTREQMNKRKAELIFYSRWVGYEVGMRHLYINHVKKPATAATYLQNELLLNPTRMDQAWLQNCVRTILRKDVQFLIANPSVLETIRIFSRERDINLQGALKGVIMVSEPCSTHLRQQFEKLFDCPIRGRYGATEQGIIAQQCRDAYHVNPVSHIVELLNVHDDEPAPAGAVGRVVITSLSALAMPLIRYETGDLAVEGYGCSCGRKGMVLTEVIGRQVEIITDTSGAKVLPLAFWNIVKHQEGVLQYQFVQKDRRDYEMRLRVSSDFKDLTDCEACLKNLLGQDANIEVRVVDEIQLLPSGKRPFIINLYGRQEQEQ